MKKHYKYITILIVLVLAFCTLLLACEKKPVLPKTPITLSFVTNVDKLEIPPIILDGINQVYMPEDPARAGYTFGGWYYDTACTQRFLVSDGLYADTTLYARWQKNAGFEDGGEPPIYVESGGFIYGVESGDYVITGYTDTKPNILIPTSYNSKPVIAIKDGAFKNNTYIENVNIGSVLQRIGEKAFENCINLKSFTVSNSDYFSSIDGILYNRDKNSILQVGMAGDILNYVIKSNIIGIREGAFYGCRFDITFAVNGKYQEIEKNDFYGFRGNLTLGSSIVGIKQQGLNGFYGGLNFGDNNKITAITLGAFDGYDGKEVILPTQMTNIFSHAFTNCKGSINLQNLKITSIANNAFAGYKGKNLVIPSTVVTIGENAFYESTTNLSFANGTTMTKVETYTFARFNGTVTFPASFVAIGSDAFWEIGSSAQVYFGNSRDKMTIEGVLDETHKAFHFANV